MEFSPALIETSKIRVAPGRQRQEFDEAAITRLSDSIYQDGLLHPVVLEKDPDGCYTLIAGERRLRAWNRLVNMKLVKSSIPARVADTPLDPEDLSRIELQENIQREDLTWQEEAIAFYKYHTLRVAREENLDESFSFPSMEGELQVSERTCRRNVKVGREILAGNESIQESTSIRAADAILSRSMKRSVEIELTTFGEIDIDVPAAKPKLESSPEIDLELDLDIKPSSDPDLPFQVLIGEFLPVLTQSYEGPPFNFIHCDFPFGVALDKSKQMSVSSYGETYDDSEDAWNDCLLNFQALMKSDLVSASAHIMFWFPMSRYEETQRYLSDTLDLYCNPYPLIWGKSDKIGIIPDAARYPRRIYESAFLCSRGDRKILTPTVNLAWHSSQKAEAPHPSYKPETMLGEFFKMFINSESVVLDPTCGSGSALCKAIQLHARYVTGVELSPEYASIAAERCGAANRLVNFGA